MRKPDASAGNPAQNERWGKMTNGEEYKKAEERTSAFNYYCEGQDTDCKGCPLSGNKKALCRYARLELEAEAEEEKPMPCMF